MELPELTEAKIRSYTIPQNFDYGMAYFEDGNVLEIMRRGNVISASVQGNASTPYQIGIQLDEVGIGMSICTCPDDSEEPCKHIVATLLTYLHKPDAVYVKPSLPELLEGLSAEQLRELVIGLLLLYPDGFDWVESEALRFKQS